MFTVSEFADVLADNEPSITGSLSNRNENDKLHSPDIWFKYSKDIVDTYRPLLIHGTITTDILVVIISYTMTGRYIDSEYYKRYADNILTILMEKRVDGQDTNEQVIKPQFLENSKCVPVELAYNISKRMMLTQ